MRVQRIAFFLCVGSFALGCDSGDSPASAEDTDVGSSSTASDAPVGSTGTTSSGQTSSEPPVGDSSSGAEDSGETSTGGEATTGGPEDPYGVPPNCASGASLVSFGEVQVCAPPCEGDVCPDPLVSGLDPLCAIGTAEDPTPQFCMLGCDPLADACPQGSACVDLGGAFGCGVGGEGPGSGTGEPMGGCEDACSVLIDCDFGGPASLLDMAECVSACEENVASLPDFCEPRLDAFLGCVADETCLTAEDSCLLSGSQFQMCLL